MEDRLTAAGAHVHAHFYLYARYLDRDAWREAWRDCLDLEAEAEGLALDWSAIKDGLPIIDIRQVKARPRPGREDETSEDAALDEVSKYITKVADLLEPDACGRVVDRDVLLGLCDVARWPRMFELLGRARGLARPKAGALLDTSCISAALAAAELGRAKAVQVYDLMVEALEPEEKAKLESDILKMLEPKLARPPTWRQLMLTKTFQEWAAIMDGRAKRGARFRLNWLREHNPRLYLADLAGRVVAYQGLEDGFAMV